MKHAWLALLVACGDAGLDSYDTAGAAGGPAPSMPAASLVPIAPPNVGLAKQALSVTTYTFINSNNGAAIWNDGTSDKHKCLRAVMMSVNAGMSNQFDCTSDTCTQHTAPHTVVATATSCYDDGGANPLRFCKLSGSAWSPWVTLMYTQGAKGCAICAQGTYNKNPNTHCVNLDDGYLQDAYWFAAGAVNTFTRVKN